MSKLFSLIIALSVLGAINNAYAKDELKGWVSILEWPDDEFIAIFDANRLDDECIAAFDGGYQSILIEEVKKGYHNYNIEWFVQKTKTGSMKITNLDRENFTVSRVKSKQRSCYEKHLDPAISMIDHDYMLSKRNNAIRTDYKNIGEFFPRYMELVHNTPDRTPSEADKMGISGMFD
jgi:hypothetical protein